MFAKLFTITGLASAASAHMLMTNPVPYGLSDLDNSPLLADGSNYPCKMRADAFDAQGASNVYAQGSTQKLSFKGTAVHGGGSCQISITTDLQPNKNSKFKVIKSIEGGCPAKDQAGNMGNDANAVDPYTYDYTIPKDLAAGNYTLAWSWFNKVGNREMYMNCAPLTVTGSGGSSNALDNLPDIFVANINSCIIDADKDVVFPNPGSDVDKFNGNTEAWFTPTDPACALATGGGSGGNNGAPTTAVAVPTTAAPNESAPSATAPGGVFITVSNNPPATTAAPVVATTAVATSAPVATSVPSSGSGDNSGSGKSAGSACSNEGEWNCIDGSSFQRCASGTWSQTEKLATGVSCTPGLSNDLTLSAKRATVNMRRAIRKRL
ncbi:hypothetical protein BGZ63DRAFT_424289 [Mariannaea sp. PMI_226]|nr:hypothetical protein BGZ63DRAFT_424289 [Mariannaea sp. PMI_226]